MLGNLYSPLVDLYTNETQFEPQRHLPFGKCRARRWEEEHMTKLASMAKHWIVDDLRFLSIFTGHPWMPAAATVGEDDWTWFNGSGLDVSFLRQGGAMSGFSEVIPLRTYWMYLLSRLLHMESPLAATGD